MLKKAAAISTIFMSMSLGLFLAVQVNRNVRAGGFFKVALFYPMMIPVAAAQTLWAKDIRAITTDSTSIARKIISILPYRSAMVPHTDSITAKHKLGRELRDLL